MKQKQLEDALAKMEQSEFLKDEFSIVDAKVDTFIREVNDFFGYNDGEPLDQDGIKFIITVLELKWKLANAIYEED
ncbi:hypothetical protein LCGC14_0372450 [marine sediment metagenome]|uniref:Uncharacterized protein n=1 Tax=marine sediment metagenome TaxID=412755 RepID=A0A0F9TAK4_9ZZZZ